MNFRLLIHILIFLSSSKTVVHAPMVEIQDQFGDKTSLLIYGSEIAVLDPSNNVEWKVDNVPVKRGRDPKKFKIDHNVSFGQYEYVIDKQAHKGPKISYYLCDDSGDDCQNGAECSANGLAGVNNATLCVVKQKNVQKCATLDEASCREVHSNLQSLKVCPGKMAYDTMCQSWSFHRPGYCEATLGSFCLAQDQFQLYFAYTNKWLPMGWYVLRPDGDQLKLRCIGIDAQQAKVQICEKVDEKCNLKNIACEEYVKMGGPQRAGSISKFFALATKIGKSNDAVRSFVFVVNMPAKVTAAIDGSGCSTIVCTIEKSSGMFRVKWSIKVDDAVVDSQNSFESSSTKEFKINPHGTYTCVAEIRFRTCSPFAEYYKTINSESVKCSFPEGLAGGEATKASIVLPLVLGCIASVIIILVVLFVVFWVLPKVKAKRAKKIAKLVSKKTGPDEKTKVTSRTSDVKEVCSIAGSGTKKITIVVDSGNSEISEITEQAVTKPPKAKTTTKAKQQVDKVKKSKVSKSLKGKTAAKKQPEISRIPAPSKIDKSPKGKTVTSTIQAPEKSKK